MNNKGDSSAVELFLFFAIGVVVVLLFTNKTYRDGYREGQIDALSGNVQYEQVLKNEWVEINQK